MNPSFVPIIVLWIIIFITFRNQKTAILTKVIKKRKSGGNREMQELAKRFIDKECIIYSFSGNHHMGTIKEVTDGALLVENEGKSEAINLEFVLRIREYPKKKNGKKKSVVLD